MPLIRPLAKSGAAAPASLVSARDVDVPEHDSWGEQTADDNKADSWNTSGQGPSAPWQGKILPRPAEKACGSASWAANSGQNWLESQWATPGAPPRPPSKPPPATGSKGDGAAWPANVGLSSPPERRPASASSSRKSDGGSWSSSSSATGDSWQMAGWGPSREAWTSSGKTCSASTPFTALFVAEKPAIARAIAGALAKSGKGQGKGYNEEKSAAGASVPVYCLDVPWTCRSPPMLSHAPSVKLRITSTVGHVYTCEFPQRMRSWKVDPETLFDAQVQRIQPDNGQSRIPDHLAGEAEQCHAVVLWLDCDREGENICYEVLENVLPNLCQHPRINAPPLPANPQEENYRNDPRVWRVHFSSLAPADLAQAFSNLRKPNPWDSMAVEARQEIDLKVGVALTRLITSSLRDSVSDLCPAREDGKGPMISYGPCQTPTLAFCVQRWDAMQRFNKETSFTIQASILSPGGGDAVSLQWVPPQSQDANSGDTSSAGDGTNAKGGWNSAWQSDGWQSGSGDAGNKGGAKGKKGGPRHSKEQLERWIAQVKRWEQKAVVTSRESEERKVERPTALNTVAMLKAASRELGMDPHKCMQVAEKLYTSGMLTYPRTETTQYPASMNIKKMIGEHTGHPKWGTWCQQLLNGDLQDPVQGTDQGDHPPITPVWCVPEDRLQRTAGVDGARLFELVVRYFIASVSPDLWYWHHKVAFSIGSLNFALEGNDIHYQGFSRICRGASMHDSAVHAANLLKGSTLAAAKGAKPGAKYDLSEPLAVSQVESSPPELLTEADLLGLMEKHGIGTDASMPTHVHNVVTRGYVEVLDPGRRMRPTVLGVALVHGLRQVDNELVKPAIRARIERDVSEIAKRRRQFAEVVASALATFREKYRNVHDGMPKMLEEFEWKRKKWRQWKDHDDKFAKQKPSGGKDGKAAPADGKGGASGVQGKSAATDGAAWSHGSSSTAQKGGTPGNALALRSDQNGNHSKGKGSNNNDTFAGRIYPVGKDAAGNGKADASIRRERSRSPRRQEQDDWSSSAPWRAPGSTVALTPNWSAAGKPGGSVVGSAPPTSRIAAGSARSASWNGAGKAGAAAPADVQTTIRKSGRSRSPRRKGDLRTFIEKSGIKLGGNALG